MTVFVYVNTSKQVGDPEHVKVFATTDAAEKWFEAKLLPVVGPLAVPVLTARALSLTMHRTKSRNVPMEKSLLLTVCAVLVAFGTFTIAVSAGFFMQLLGAIVMALGGSAACLISSHRSPEAPRK